MDDLQWFMERVKKIEAERRDNPAESESYWYGRAIECARLMAIAWERERDYTLSRVKYVGEKIEEARA